MSVKASLTKKVGPLPTYVWVLVGVAVIVGVMVLRSRNSGGSSATGAAPVSTDPALDPTTGQPFAGGMTGSTLDGGSTNFGSPPGTTEFDWFLAEYQKMIDAGFIIPGGATNGDTPAPITGTPATGVDPGVTTDHSSPPAPAARGVNPWDPSTWGPDDWAAMAKVLPPPPELVGKSAGSGAVGFTGSGPSKPKAGYQFLQDTGPRAGQSYNLVSRGGKMWRYYANGDKVIRP